MQVQPYLFFEGRAEEAIEFYKKTIGAQVQMIMRYSESPQPCPEGMIPPGSEHKVMHGAITVGTSTVMLSDGRVSGKPNFDGFSLSLDYPSDDEARRVFDALADGGNVVMPMGETFYATSFGMLKDRFGMHWMVIVPKQPPGK